jgi:hypothetical protein
MLSLICLKIHPLRGAFARLITALFRQSDLWAALVLKPLVSIDDKEKIMNELHDMVRARSSLHFQSNDHFIQGELQAYRETLRKKAEKNREIREFCANHRRHLAEEQALASDVALARRSRRNG